MPEPATKTIGPEGVVSEIFLTPRVIDAGAFGKYSAVLRELIESSVSASTRLAAERERAEAAIERARALAAGAPNGEGRPAGKTLQASVDQAAAVRIARLEATVAELAGRLEQAEASASEAKSIARGERGARDPMDGASELTPEFDEALARAEAGEDRLRKLIGMAEQAGEELSERVGDVIGKAANSGAELTAMIMMLAEQIEKAEALGEIGVEREAHPSAAAGPSAAAAAMPVIDAETVRRVGELVERVSEAAQIAGEKCETLERLNLRADASGEALLRAVRSATDGAVNAERIAERLGGLIRQAAAVRAMPTSGVPGQIGPRGVPESLAAGERLAIGAMGLGAGGLGAVANEPKGNGSGSIASNDARAAAAQRIVEIDGPVGGPDGGPVGGPVRATGASPFTRPFPPTPIDPALANRPRLRKPDRPIDSEDFGAMGAD